MRRKIGFFGEIERSENWERHCSHVNSVKCQHSSVMIVKFEIIVLLQLRTEVLMGL